MPRLAMATSLLLTLALGTVADGKCRVCIQSVIVDRVDGPLVTIALLAISDEGFTLPSAAKMTIDGASDEIALTKVEGTTWNGMPAVRYAGTTKAFATGPLVTLTGRVYVAGETFAFRAPLGGGSGSAQLLTAAAAREFATSQAPAPTAATSVAPSSAPVPASEPLTAGVGGPALAIGAVGVALIALLGLRRTRRASA